MNSYTGSRKVEECNYLDNGVIEYQITLRKDIISKIEYGPHYEILEKEIDSLNNIMENRK